MFTALVELENAKPDIIEQKFLGFVSAAGQPQDLPGALLRDLILYDNYSDTDEDDDAFSEWLEDTKDDEPDFLDH